MAEFIRSVVLDAHTMATEVVPYDLPINPISHLILTVEAYNATDEPTIAEILGFINSVAILHTGRQVHNFESEDLAALNLYLYGSGGMALAPVAADNQHLSYTLIIPFGRKPFDPNECFPATRRGEFQISLDTTVPATSLDNALISISAVELPGATPSHHLKATLHSKAAPGATGIDDLELPIGNDLLAILIGMTSFPGTSEYLFGADDLRLLKDNKEIHIVSAKAPELAGEMIFRVPGTVRSDAAQGGLVPNTYIFMDFDPTRDGLYAIDTRGATSLKLRPNYGVDEALNITPVELVRVTG